MGMTESAVGARAGVRGAGRRGRDPTCARPLPPPKEERLAPSPARLRLYDGPTAGREVRLRARSDA